MRLRAPNKRASWAVVNATTGQAISAGPVPGLQQEAPVAELWGVISALRWCLHFGVTTHVWCDSKHVVDGMLRLRQTGCLPPDWPLQAEWRILQGLLEMLAPSQMRIHWIASHLPLEHAGDAFEEWCICRNSRVDAMASRHNVERGASYALLRADALAYHVEGLSRLRMLASSYNSVATESADSPPVAHIGAIDETLRYDACLGDLLPLTWRELLDEVVAPPEISLNFARELLGRMCANEDLCSGAQRVSYLELVFWLLLDGELRFPVFLGGTVQHLRLMDRMTRPTVTELLAVARRHVQWLARHFDFESLMVQHLNRSYLGIFTPQDGLWLSISSEALSQCHERLRIFTSARPIRRVCDLARPC